MRLFASAPGPREPDALIGDRVCANCGERLWEHCEVPRHYPPCCPGNCPGARTDTERLLARMITPRERPHSERHV